MTFGEAEKSGNLNKSVGRDQMLKQEMTSFSGTTHSSDSRMKRTQKQRLRNKSSPIKDLVKINKWIQQKRTHVHIDRRVFPWKPPLPWMCARNMWFEEHGVTDGTFNVTDVWVTKESDHFFRDEIIGSCEELNLHSRRRCPSVIFEEVGITSIRKKNSWHQSPRLRFWPCH